MRFIYRCLCFASVLKIVVPAPANGFVFPDDRRQERKLEPVITPPVLPVLEHLERDPSTLLPSERKPSTRGQVNPRFGFGGGFNVAPSGNGGLTASISSSANGGGSSHSASQSFSFGFNEGFSASHSASQASAFNGGFGSGFSGSQASSQAASFGGSGQSVSGAASSASSAASGNGHFGGGNFGSQSQSASSAFGFNSLNGFQQPEPFFGDGLLDLRHRGVPNFPSFPDFIGSGKSVGAAAFRTGKSGPSARNGDDFLAVLVSNPGFTL